MRLSTKLGERKNKSRGKDENRNIFFVFEGIKTEPIYFDEIFNRRTELGISEKLLLKRINRGYDEISHSNPQTILDNLFEELNNEKNNVYSIATISDRIISDLFDMALINKPKEKKYCKKIKIELEKQFGEGKLSISDINRNEKVFLKLLEDIFSRNYKELVISDIIKDLDLKYKKDFDYICLIVDRDMGSFVDNQFKTVKDLCKENGILFFVSNPCFEFWLMLHFSDCKIFSIENLRENVRQHKKTFCERQLSKLMANDYKKNCFDVASCVDNLEVAIENSNKYQTDICMLKDEVGTNLGNLFSRLRNDEFKETK